MKPRIDFQKDVPAGARQALFGLEKYVHGCGLEQSLLHLVKTRASQVNGCAYCIDMHTKDARGWRDRAAAVRAERLARDAVFHASARPSSGPRR